jgi:antitoxin (DNA-binding transcriptional repressor) of toxin-antitoxin stability system
VARAEKGETFVITKNGRPVARIVAVDEVDRAAAATAAAALRALQAEQGPPVSEEKAQQGWDEMKRELEAEDEEQVDQWLSPSTPR